MSEIRCSRCGRPTGAHFISGDPYLPYIVCTACAEDEEVAGG